MSLTPSATARAMRSRPATFRARASGVRDWIGRCSWSENHRRHTIDVANPMTTPMITEHGNSDHRHPSRRHVRRVSSALMPPCLRRRSAPSTLQRGFASGRRASVVECDRTMSLFPKEHGAEAQIGPSARSISASDGSLMDPSAAQRAVRKTETNINAAPRSMSEKRACFRNGSQAQRRPESARAKPTPSVARTPLTTRASSTRAHRARSRLNRRAACTSVKLSPGISRNSAHTRAQSSCSTGDLEDVARLAGIECMADSSHWIGTAATGAMAVPPV